MVEEVCIGAWRETSWRLPGSGLSVVGRSVAGAETRMMFPELGMCFDAGLPPPPQKPTHLFITHSHADHSFQLPYFLRREQPRLEIFLPVEAVDATRTFITSSQLLNNLREGGDDGSSRYALNGVRPGDVIAVGSRYEVRVTRCNHSVPCIGFVVSELRDKLRPDLAELSGPEIAAMRKSGQQVTTTVRRPMFCFLGDTDDSIFDESSHSRVQQEGLAAIFSAPVVFIECTYLGSPPSQAAVDEHKHIWWDRLRPVVVAHPQTMFVLMHWSERYRPHEIRTFFDKEALPNVFPWLPPH